MHTTPDLFIALADEDQELYRHAMIRVYFEELEVVLERRVEPGDDWDEDTDGPQDFLSDELSQRFSTGAGLKAFVGALVEALLRRSFVYDYGEDIDDDEALDRVGDQVGMLASAYTLKGRGRDDVDPKALSELWADYPA